MLLLRFIWALSPRVEAVKRVHSGKNFQGIGAGL
jgi:hypothetical protein